MNASRLLRDSLFVTFVISAGQPLLAGSTVVGTGTPGSCSEAALNAAIGVANANFGLVTFNCGPAPHTLLVSTEKPLANGVVVDGGGTITLSGGNATRLFNVFQGSAVEIRNIRLIKGFGAGGGCMLALSSFEEPSFLSLANVSLEECASSLYGAGLAATETHVTITGGSFSANVASNGGGGAISLNGGSLQVTGTSFSGNQAIAQGGALQIWFATATLDQSSFANNFVATSGAGQGGGAIFLRGSTATSSRTSFASNRAGVDFNAGGLGGAWHLGEASTLALADVYAAGNQAGGGGALWVDGTSSAQVLRSTFYLNSALDGGAVETVGDVDVAASTFSGNGAGYTGGAIRADGGTVDLVSVTLAANFGVLEAPSRAAVTWSSAATVTVHNSIFTPDQFDTPPCSGANSGAFTFSAWPGTSCGASNAVGNRPNTVIALDARRTTCGGLTPTHALLPPVAEGIGSCRVGDPVTDQRGVSRPQGTACEMGAVEYFPVCDNMLMADGFELGGTSSWSLTTP